MESVAEERRQNALQALRLADLELSLHKWQERLEAMESQLIARDSSAVRAS